MPGGDHWAQGSVENKHGPLRQMALKMMSDLPGSTPQDVMDECIMARNSTVVVYGFSPLQLAFAHVSELPHFPSTKEAVTISEDSGGEVYRGFLRRKLQTLQDARVQALHQMAKHRIQRALQRPAGRDGPELHIGDSVEWYTQLQKGGIWRGPGKLVLLNHPMCMI